MKFPPELADSWFTSRPFVGFVVWLRKTSWTPRSWTRQPNNEPLPREVYDRVYLTDPWVVTLSLG